MNTQICKLLQKDEVEFEQLYIERYMRWCLHVSSKTGVSFQSIFANKPLNNYYRNELSKLETKYLNTVKGKEKYLDLKELNSFYEIIVVDIFKAYPSVLVEAAKILKIINPPFYAN